MLICVHFNIIYVAKWDNNPNSQNREKNQPGS